MQNFRVRWEIDIEAETAEEAAQQALEIQRDATSLATFFEVEDFVHGRLHKIEVEPREG